MPRRLRTSQGVGRAKKAHHKARRHLRQRDERLRLSIAGTRDGRQAVTAAPTENLLLRAPVPRRRSAAAQSPSTPIHKETCE
jgi:hypothetical protein